MGYRQCLEKQDFDDSNSEMFLKFLNISLTLGKKAFNKSICISNRRRKTIDYLELHCPFDQSSL